MSLISNLKNLTSLHYFPHNQELNAKECLELINSLPKLRYFASKTKKNSILSSGVLSNHVVDLEDDHKLIPSDESQLLIDYLRETTTIFKYM